MLNRRLAFLAALALTGTVPVLPLTSAAQQEMCNLTKGAVEGDTAFVNVSFRDQRANPLRPARITYWVTARDAPDASPIYGNIVCINGAGDHADCATNTPANDTAAVMTLRLPPAATKIVDTTLTMENHYLNMVVTDIVPPATPNATPIAFGVQRCVFPVRNAGVVVAGPTPVGPTPVP